ncbi:MAG: GGDEF domain-containing protein [Betaproteobacteria bacterium]|nr:GGDEF domain-containing protein [Betaproteobacteria bacterium]
MALDVRTLVALTFLASLVSLCSMFFLYLGHRQEAALRHGVIGLGLQSLALLLFSMLYLKFGIYLPVLANTLLVASFAHMRVVARVFYGRPSAIEITWGATLAMLALSGYLTWIRDDDSARVYAFSAMIALFAPLIAREFAEPVADETWSGPRLLLRMCLYTIFLVMLLRMLLLYVGGAGESLHMKVGTTLSFLVATLLIGLWPFGLALLVGQRLQGQQRRLATTDPLTGVFNRRGFEEYIVHELTRRRRTGETMSLLLLDIDHFKRINDTYGHQAGDNTLSRFAGKIAGSLREIDSFGRLGGEEFAILLPATPHAQALEAAERLRKSITGLDLEAGSQRYTITVSIGVVSSDGDGEDYASLYREADRRLYAAKEAGRNRVIGRTIGTHPEGSTGLT